MSPIVPSSGEAAGREHRDGYPACLNATRDAFDAPCSDVDGGAVRFVPKKQIQRTALTLANGVVYAAYASYCDLDPFHGWVVAWDARTLKQVAAWNDSPNGIRGGIWQSGQGPAVDDAGDIYLIKGNGDVDESAAPSAFGDTFVRLHLAPSGLGVADWFTPFDAKDLDAGANDLDLGSSGAMLVPGTTLLVGAGKEGKLYVVDRTRMGHFHAGDDSQIVQSFQAVAIDPDASLTHHLHGGPVFWRGPSGAFLYLWGENDVGRAFRFDGAKFEPTAAMQTTTKAVGGMPGGVLSLSANGAMPGSAILWASLAKKGDASEDTVPGVLRAFDASDLSNELWNSEMNAARDAVGDLAKFAPPTVANGRVYVATFSGKLRVYGLLPKS